MYQSSGLTGLTGQNLSVADCVLPRRCSDFPHGHRKLKPLESKETMTMVQVGRESKEKCCSHYSLITSAYEPIKAGSCKDRKNNNGRKIRACE